MLIKQLSIFVENKPGRLAEITELVAQAKLDIRALSLADTTDFGILRMIVNDPPRGEAVLREAGLAVALTDVLAIDVADKPGSFAAVMRALAEADVNIEYLYAGISRETGRAEVFLRAENPEKASMVIEKM